MRLVHEISISKWADAKAYRTGKCRQFRIGGLGVLARLEFNARLGEQSHPFRAKRRACRAVLQYRLLLVPVCPHPQAEVGKNQRGEHPFQFHVFSIIRARPCNTKSGTCLVFTCNRAESSVASPPVITVCLVSPKVCRNSLIRRSTAPVHP